MLRLGRLSLSEVRIQSFAIGNDAHSFENGWIRKVAGFTIEKNKKEDVNGKIQGVS